MSPGAPATAADLLLAAAGEVEPDDDPHRWRDLAVRHAVQKAWLAGDLDDVRALAAGYDTLLLLGPAREEDGRIRLRSVGNSERRHRGAFSTPPAFADSLARRVLTGWTAPDLEGRPDVGAVTSSGPGTCGDAGSRLDSRAVPLAVPTVVDPACGAGALLRAVLARLLAAGTPPATAGAALHGVDADPVAVELARAALAADLTAAGFACEPGWFGERIIAGDGLLGATPRRPAAGPGVTWHESFPDVLDRPGASEEPVTGWRGGFDAVVANPPWERLKVHARDWGGTAPPGLRADRADVARALRDAGRHPLTGAGELNAYLPFVETCWRLLAPHGRAALLVPAGIASDRSAARLIEALAAAGCLSVLHLIDPGATIFAGVSGRVGVAVVELTGGPHPRHDGHDAMAEVAPVVTQVAVGLAGPDEPPGPRSWPLSAALLRVLNPNTGTAPLFGSATDARIVTAVHRSTPVLLRRAAGGSPPSEQWHLRLVTPLHMTRDARWFSTQPGDDLLPLWEAKHCALLDPHGGSMLTPRYWVPRTLVEDRYGDLAARGWLAGYRNVSTTAAARTLLPSPIPVAGVGNSLPLITAPRLPLLLAALSTLPVDYLLRQKHAGANVNFFKLEQVPVPAPAAYDQPSPWGPGTVGDWVLRRFARAVVWTPSLSGLAAELTGMGVPVPADDDPQERALARAELDAAHAVLLGLNTADLTHLLGTFTALRTREVRLTGHFRSADLVLQAYRRLTGPAEMTVVEDTRPLTLW